uniref:NADH-ubiquinone oxidoreductase chain 6 n=1 Tax=Dibolia occultans TaxID=1425563 RepID=A0A3G1GPA3_9CUCU|nr:NADH dehydrogenase subunit 6 [Dibolia occultans]
MMIFPLLMMNSFLLILMKHPLSCGLILLIQTILTALITGFMHYNFWFSYILFLIMIGGMMILFIYMTSIASNEKFKFNFNLFILFLLMIFSILLIKILLDPFYLNLMNQFNEMFTMNKNFNFSLIKYCNYPNYFIMIMLISYLFITLIAIVKLTSFNYGSLRQKF